MRITFWMCRSHRRSFRRRFPTKPSRSHAASPKRLITSARLCVEFFLTRDGKLLVNELAPRPHNSGHLTFDACVTSQFEQQLRAVCGLPLGSTEFYRPAAMANLLGDVWAERRAELGGRSRCAERETASVRQGRSRERPKDGTSDGTAATARSRADEAADETAQVEARPNIDSSESSCKVDARQQSRKAYR